MKKSFLISLFLAVTAASYFATHSIPAYAAGALPAVNTDLGCAVLGSPVAYLPPSGQVGCTNVPASLSQFVSTGTQTVTTATDTSLLGSTGSGSTTVMANYLHAGNILQFTIYGFYTTPAVNTNSFTIKIKVGSTTIASVTTSTLISSASNQVFMMNVVCPVGTTGATIQCVGSYNYSQTLTGGSLISNMIASASPVTIVPTGALTFDVTAAWSGTTGAPTATAIVARFQIQ